MCAILCLCFPSETRYNYWGLIVDPFVLFVQCKKGTGIPSTLVIHQGLYRNLVRSVLHGFSYKSYKHMRVQLFAMSKTLITEFPISLCPPLCCWHRIFSV